MNNSHYDFDFQLQFQFHCRNLHNIFPTLLCIFFWDYLKFTECWNTVIFLICIISHSALRFTWFPVLFNYSNQFSFYSRLYDNFDNILVDPIDHNLVDTRIKKLSLIHYLIFFFLPMSLGKEQKGTVYPMLTKCLVYSNCSVWSRNSF